MNRSVRRVAFLVFAVAFPLLVSAAHSTPRPLPLQPNEKIIPLFDGSFLIPEVDILPGAFRFVHVLGDGTFLNEIAFKNAAGFPIAATPENPQALWFLSVGPTPGTQTLQLIRDDGTLLRQLAVPIALGPDGNPDGSVLADLSPSGTWGVLRTLPASAAPSQLEWWNLLDGSRFPILSPQSSFDPALRRNALAAADVHPAWGRAFLLTARKERFSDVLAEVESSCQVSLPFALPDSDRVLGALPIDGGLALFLVERSSLPGAPLDSPAGTKRDRTARLFLVGYDSGGHLFRSDDLGVIDESRAARGLDQMKFAISPDATRILRTSGDGFVETVDPMAGRWERFSVFAPTEGEGWAAAQDRGTAAVRPPASPAAR